MNTRGLLILATLFGLGVLSMSGKVIYTGDIAGKVVGYNGPTPLRITVVDGRITAITAEKNSETPQYFERAKSKIFPKFIGKTVDEALKMKVDAVTGATYSSEAIIKNIQLGLNQEKAGAKKAAPAKKKSAAKKGKKRMTR